MRFTTVDPLAEMDYNVSPYAYCEGNPVNRIDPDGKEVATMDENARRNLKNAFTKSEAKYIKSQSRKYNNKEFIEMHGYDTYDYGGRWYDPAVGGWSSVDPLAEKYPWCSPYVYCNNNPVKYIDPTGLAWRSTNNQNTGEQTGYEWVPEDQSYNKDGSLKTGLYAQAIFFGENGTYDSNSDYNMGSSTAYVYLADGTTTTFDASTHPSDQDNYATVPAGLYEAKVGQHKGSYTALRMGDVGTTNFDNNRIELGTENPAFDDGRTYATGINIHKPGIGNKTGMTTSGSPISAGCSLIDRDSWGDFIGIFNTSEQRNNVVSVTMSRTMAQPTNTNILLRVPTGPIPSELLQRPNATRVAIPYRR